jgi:hypothetical protein
LENNHDKIHFLKRHQINIIHKEKNNCSSFASETEGSQMRRTGTPIYRVLYVNLGEAIHFEQYHVAFTNLRNKE